MNLISRFFQTKQTHLILKQLARSQPGHLDFIKMERLSQILFNSPQELQDFYAFFVARISKFQPSQDSLSKLVNQMIVANYLLLHGPTAFSDCLSRKICILKKLSKLRIESKDRETPEAFRTKNRLLNSRARGIVQLLEDKQTLYQQRQRFEAIRFQIINSEAQSFSALKWFDYQKNILLDRIGMADQLVQSDHPISDQLISLNEF